LSVGKLDKPKAAAVSENKKSRIKKDLDSLTLANVSRDVIIDFDNLSVPYLY
jgi:hypothetical protein